jgi:hypothetical protein
LLTLRRNIVMNFLKCLRQYSSRRLWLNIHLTTSIICEKTSFMTRLKMSFSFETMFEAILTIVWLISFSKISEKSMLFEYVDLAMSSRFAATNEKKNEFIKHWIFAFLMKIMMSSERRRNEMMSLNDVARFVAHLISFHVFWASSIALKTTFRWIIRRIFRMIRFLIARAFLQIWSVCSVFLWTTSSSWNVLRAWFARVRVRLHASSKSKMTRIDALNFEVDASMTSVIAKQTNLMYAFIWILLKNCDVN